MADHAIRFWTLAADSEWNPQSLSDTFLHSLSDDIKDHLAPLDLPSHFDALVALAIKIDNRLFEGKKEKKSVERRTPAHWGQSTSWSLINRHSSSAGSSNEEVTAPPGEKEEPMRVGQTRLSPEERQRRLREGRCIYCGLQGHFLAACLVKGRAHQ